MTGHEVCPHCDRTGWLSTSRDRNEVTRCPGPQASTIECHSLQTRATENWDRHEADRYDARQGSRPPEGWRDAKPQAEDQRIVNYQPELSEEGADA